MVESDRSILLGPGSVGCSTEEIKHSTFTLISLIGSGSMALVLVSTPANGFPMAVALANFTCVGVCRAILLAYVGRGPSAMSFFTTV